MRGSSDIRRALYAAASRAWVARRTVLEKQERLRPDCQVIRVKILRTSVPNGPSRELAMCFSEAVGARARLRDKVDTNQHNLLCQAPPAPGNMTPSQGEGAMDT